MWKKHIIYTLQIKLIYIVFVYSINMLVDGIKPQPTIPSACVAFAGKV